MIEDPWRCRLCGIAYPVPSLARCCELEHHRLKDATPDDQETNP